MKKLDLFIMMFYALDSLWDESKEELGMYLSSANPFLFDDCNSADPSIFEDFEEKISIIDDKDCGYNNVVEYLKTINDGKFVEEFTKIDKKEWAEKTNEFLKR